jgi:hypothetical protein
MSIHLRNVATVYRQGFHGLPPRIDHATHGSGHKASHHESFGPAAVEVYKVDSNEQ